MNSTLQHAPQAATPAIVLFRMRAGDWYPLDTASRLSGLSRHSIVVLCRAGVVRPEILPPYGVMAFDPDSIITLRRIEQLRRLHSLDGAALRTIVPLLVELENLRAEVKFWRSH